MKVTWSEKVSVREYIPQKPIVQMKKSDWVILFSNKRSAYYYFNRKTGHSSWNRPKEKWKPK